MDHASLVALFRRIVLGGSSLLLSAGLSAGCGPYGDPCPSSTRTIALQLTDAGSDGGSADASIDDLIAGCQASPAGCTALCEHFETYNGQFIALCKPDKVDGGIVLHIEYTAGCGGRCPEGLAPAALRGAGHPLGAWLAASAHLEAASVDAFEILAAELGAHGAPPALTKAARAAITDERRHAETVGRLAARCGALPPTAQVNRGPVRDLESIARENAVEGCARETYAALLAFRQGCAATDPAVRSAMACIARDEARHAALAWAVDAWSRPLLTPAARRRVREVRHEAIEGLVTAPLADLSRDDREAAGLPDEDAAAKMARELGGALVER